MPKLTLENWEQLSVRERIHLCRDCAREAEMLAQAAHQKRRYKDIAAQWHQISAELEAFGRTKRPLPVPLL